MTEKKRITARGSLQLCSANFCSEISLSMIAWAAWDRSSDGRPRLENISMITWNPNTLDVIGQQIAYLDLAADGHISRDPQAVQWTASHGLASYKLFSDPLKYSTGIPKEGRKEGRKVGRKERQERANAILGY